MQGVLYRCTFSATAAGSTLHYFHRFAATLGCNTGLPTVPSRIIQYRISGFGKKATKTLVGVIQKQLY